MFDRPARISFVGVAMARKYGLLSGCTALTKFMMDDSWVRVAFKIIGAHGYIRQISLCNLQVRSPRSLHHSGVISYLRIRCVVPFNAVVCRMHI